jgi:hypothetical protein
VPARAAPHGGAPGARLLAAATSFGGALYFIGGIRPAAAAVGAAADSAAAAAAVAGPCLWDCWKFIPDDVAHPAAGGAWSEVPLTGARPVASATDDDDDAGGGGVNPAAAADAAPGLCGAAAVLLPARGQLLLFGGKTNGGGYSAQALAVQLTTGEVTRLSATAAPSDDADVSAATAPPDVPSARYAASAALLPCGGRVLLIGGGTDAADARDAWLFDVSSRHWAPVELPNEGPPEAELPGRTYGMQRQVLGRQTLLATLPLAAEGTTGCGGVTTDVVVWGGRFLVRPPSSAAQGLRVATMVHNGMRIMRLKRVGGEHAAAASEALLRRCALPSCGAAEARPRAFKVCGRCKRACYCGEAHQAADWARHKTSRRLHAGSELSYHKVERSLFIASAVACRRCAAYGAATAAVTAARSRAAAAARVSGPRAARSAAATRSVAVASDDAV